MAKANKTAPKKAETAAEASAAFSAHLVAFLQNHTHVRKIWISPKGEYHLSPKEGFVEYDADDILDGDPPLVDLTSFASANAGAGDPDGGKGEGGNGGEDADVE